MSATPPPTGPAHLEDGTPATLDDQRDEPTGVTVPEGTDLWVFAFDDELLVHEARMACSRLVTREWLKLEDMVVVTKDARGKVRLIQSRDLNPSQGAATGGWWGAIAGLFVAQPLIGAALGASLGGLFAKLRDIGIDDDEMKAMGDDLAVGESALFLLVTDCHQVRVLHEVSRFQARLLTTTADPSVAEQVRDRLAVDPWG